MAPGVHQVVGRVSAGGVFDDEVAVSVHFDAVSVIGAVVVLDSTIMVLDENSGGSVPGALVSPDQRIASDPDSLVLVAGCATVQYGAAFAHIDADRSIVVGRAGRYEAVGVDQDAH